MITLKNTKASHVGIVLSFVIFITFLIFLYSIVEPATNIQRGKQKTIELLVPELMSFLEKDMTSVTINLKNYTEDVSGKDCINLPPIIGLAAMGSVAKAENNDLLGSTLKEEGDDTTDVEWAKTDGEILKLFYSREFIQMTSDDNCDIVDENDFDYGLIRTNGYIFESGVNATILEMEDNRAYYEELKLNLSIPLGDEFGFGFRNAEGAEVATSEREVTADIYVEEIPTQYVDEEANIKSGFLLIKVW